MSEKEQAGAMKKFVKLGNASKIKMQEIINKEPKRK